MAARLECSLGQLTLPEKLSPEPKGTRPAPTAPRWSSRPLSRSVLPRGLHGWLTDSGSLTAKLMHLSGGRFRVQVLSQTYGRPHLNEARALGLPRHQLALVREVVLRGDDQPWVFARSLLPLSSLTGRLRQLRKQGNRPLGAFLFSQAHLERSPIALSQISRHHNYLPVSLLGAEPVWGRRSIFYIDNKPLLVSEVFLPGFPSMPTPDPSSPITPGKSHP